jgi:D-alanyl-D-alanine carboxypeptidase
VSAFAFGGTIGYNSPSWFSVRFLSRDSGSPVVQFPKALLRISVVALAAGAALGGTSRITQAGAEAFLLAEVDSGRVIQGENATYPWYPASVTKLMTTYVTLKALRDRRLTLETLVTVSPNAVAQQPSKMGFKVGTQLTVDNALKMLLVHSANDMAVVLAEGVSGSIEKFADEMNASARHLGMTQTNYVNPNGLPADEQITSARDLAILARALIREFPEYDSYWHIPAIKLGKRLYRNTNRLIDAYPGADGMKTGFICASGFNLVATATRDNKRLVAVVLGAPSSTARASKAAQLLERGFTPSPLSWLMPPRPTLDQLQPISATPPNLRDEICGKNRRRAPAEETEEDEAVGDAAHSFLSVLRGVQPPAAALLTSGLAAAVPPVEVYVGPPHHPGSVEAALATPPPARKKKPETAAAAIPTEQAAKKPEGSVLAAKPAKVEAKPVSDATHAMHLSPVSATGLKPWPGEEPAKAKPKAAVVAAKPKSAPAPKTDTQ